MDDYRAAALDAARKLGTFTTAKLAEAVKVSQPTAARLIETWRAAGFAEARPGEGRPQEWKLTDRSRLLSRSTPELNLWRTLIKLGTASPRDLAAHASTEQAPVSETKAAEFCRMLLDAGFVRVMQKAAPTRDRPAIYRLVRQTGPLPPERRRVTVIVDPNEHSYLKLPEVRP